MIHQFAKFSNHIKIVAETANAYHERWRANVSVVCTGLAVMHLYGEIKLPHIVVVFTLCKLPFFVTLVTKLAYWSFLSS